MKNHEKMDDEKLLRLAALSIHENAVAEYEALEDAPELATEQEIQKQWNAVMKKHRQKERCKLLSLLPGTFVRKAAAVIAALSVLGGGVTATVAAVNPQIRDVFSTDFEDHSVFSIIFSDKRPEIPEEWDERYYPTYMPSGYEYAAINQCSLWNELVFQDEEKKIHFVIYPIEMNIGINTENLISAEMKINGFDATLYSNKEDTRSILMIRYSDCVVGIGGAIQTIEIISVGESIKIKE